VIIATLIGVSIHLIKQQKEGNKMSTETIPLIELREGGLFYPHELREICQAIYIVNRDAPSSSAGAMVSIYVQINQDSFGETRFGLLPMLKEIEVVSSYDVTAKVSDQEIYFGVWGHEDTFVLMGHAVNLALEITSLAGERSPVTFLKNDCPIYVINESGTTESTMCSVYSYMAERGFPF
jgi:hypothetical protein